MAGKVGELLPMEWSYGRAKSEPEFPLWIVLVRDLRLPNKGPLVLCRGAILRVREEHERNFGDDSAYRVNVPDLDGFLIADDDAIVADDRATAEKESIRLQRGKITPKPKKIQQAAHHISPFKYRVLDL